MNIKAVFNDKLVQKVNNLFLLLLKKILLLDSLNLNFADVLRPPFSAHSVPGCQIKKNKKNNQYVEEIDALR